MIAKLNGVAGVNKVGDDYILFPNAANETDGVYIVTLNEMGYYIYSLIDGVRTVDDIINQISDEYEADRTLISSDVNRIINQLLERKFISVSSQ